MPRQAQNNNPHNLVPMWKIRRDLECEIIIPLPLYNKVSIQALAAELDGYEQAERLLNILQAQSYREPRIADLNLPDELAGRLCGQVSTPAPACGGGGRFLLQGTDAKRVERSAFLRC